MSNNFSMCQAGRSFIKSLPKEEQERIKTLAEQKGFCPWAYYDAKKDSKWGMFKVQNGISFVKSFPQKEREQLEIALDELLTNEQLVRQNAVVNVERRFKKKKDFILPSPEEIAPHAEHICKTLFDGHEIFKWVAAYDAYGMSDHSRAIMPMLSHDLKELIDICGNFSENEQAGC